MTRVAIYARFSSAMQSEASIDEQLRICQERALREGWTVAAVFSDLAISGSSMQRLAVQNLMEQASQGCFDIVMKLGVAQSFFAKVQEGKQRLDVVEFISGLDAANAL